MRIREGLRFHNGALGAFARTAAVQLPSSMASCRAGRRRDARGPEGPRCGQEQQLEQYQQSDHACDEGALTLERTPTSISVRADALLRYAERLGEPGRSRPWSQRLLLTFVGCPAR
jgi:hypothetical protein